MSNTSGNSMRSSLVVGALVSTAILGAMGCSESASRTDEMVDVSTAAIVQLPNGCSASGQCKVQATLPDGATLGNFAVVAAQSVRLAPRAHATDGFGQPAAILALGTEGLAVGNGATSGSLFSGGDVWLDAASVITGSVSAKGFVHQQSGVTVTGAIREQVAFSTHQEEVVPSVNMPTTWKAAVNLEPNQTKSILPGAYSGFNVKSGAKLFLAKGRYFVGSMYLEPGGTIKLDNVTAPVEVHVLDQMSCKGNWQPATGSSNVRIIYWGTNWVVSECMLGSTALVAPNAPVRIADRMNSGQVIAKHVELGVDATTALKPFHSLTTGPGETKLKDLTLSQRQNACSALAQFYTAADETTNCRVRAWNTVRAGKPATDAEAVTQCSQAYDACMANSNCDSSTSVPTTCDATVDQRDTCFERIQPSITSVFANLRPCAEFTVFRAYAYRPNAPLPVVPECAALNGCL